MKLSHVNTMNDAQKMQAQQAAAQMAQNEQTQQQAAEEQQKRAQMAEKRAAMLKGVLFDFSICTEDSPKKRESHRAFREIHELNECLPRGTFAICVLISGLLSEEAHQRLERVAMVNPQKKMACEEMIFGMLQQGMRQKIDENTIIQMMETVDKQMKPQTTVQLNKNRGAFDSDSEEIDIEDC